MAGAGRKTEAVYTLFKEIPAQFGKKGNKTKS